MGATSVVNDGLTQVMFTGSEPTTLTSGDQYYASLGTAEGLTVVFPARYLAQEGQRGFTTPTWRAYTALPAYTVSFDTADGSIDPMTTWAGKDLDPPTPVRAGYTFAGWYTSPDSDTRYDSGFAVTGGLTVHARWQPVSDQAGSSSLAGSLSGGSLPGSGSGSARPSRTAARMPERRPGRPSSCDSAHQGRPSSRAIGHRTRSVRSSLVVVVIIVVVIVEISMRRGSRTSGPAAPR